MLTWTGGSNAGLSYRVRAYASDTAFTLADAAGAACAGGRHLQRARRMPQAPWTRTASPSLDNAPNSSEPHRLTVDDITETPEPDAQ